MFLRQPSIRLVTCITMAPAPARPPGSARRAAPRSGPCCGFRIRRVQDRTERHPESVADEGSTPQQHMYVVTAPCVARAPSQHRGEPPHPPLSHARFVLQIYISYVAQLQPRRLPPRARLPAFCRISPKLGAGSPLRTLDIGMNLRGRPRASRCLRRPRQRYVRYSSAVGWLPS